MAYDSQYEDEPAKPPLSLHPAFPAIVALWFAALLGLGSLVLPAVLLERMVVATGVASIVPAAAPPLGITARGIIALAGALAGCGLGVLIARRVAQAHRPEPVSRIAKLAGGSRRPISVHDELGGEGLVNGEAPPLNRRRALAISEDDRPSDFLYQIPLPGTDPHAAAPIVDAPESSGADDEPLELSELAGDADASADAGGSELADEAEQDETDGDFEMNDSRTPGSAWPSHQHLPPQADAGELDTRKNLAGPRGLEPLPFAAPSLARRAPEPEPEPEPEQEPEFHLEVQLEAVAAPAPEEPAYRADWQTAPLEGLGLVQLVQRLGSTIERRRELAAQNVASVAAVAAPFSAPPADLEPALAEEAAQAMAAFFAPASAPETDEPEVAAAGADFAPVEPGPVPVAMARPEFLQSIAEDDEDDDDDDAAPDFSLPLRRPAAAAPSFAPADNDAEQAEAEDDEEAEEDNGYTSLLELNNPFVASKAEFVRIDEPEQEGEPAGPAVVFPGQEESARSAGPAPGFGGRIFDPPGKPAAAPAPAPQASADADAALRAALATLQRMSGAA